MQEIEFESANVLIVGAGGSALSCAAMLADAGVSGISILNKTTPILSHTGAAKGGINASLGNVYEDNWEWHAFDTIKAATHELANIDLINKMCEMAPEIISWLAKCNVRFDLDTNGKIAQRRYGGQTTHFGDGDPAYRACFVADHTGQEIIQKLYLYISSISGIRFYNNHFAYRLLGNTLYCIDFERGIKKAFTASFIIFAGGGFSQIYKTNSSSLACTGDAQAILYSAGYPLQDLEFVQFNPTGLCVSGPGNGILVSEAARGEGGYLLNEKGERFMYKYSNLAELAPRDVVARAIYSEVGTCYLQVRHLEKSKLDRLIDARRVSTFFAGINFEKENIPVFPTAHYNMGGIQVNNQYMVSDGLYAIGECASARIHGANRLGCNSLLELFFSAKIVANDIIAKDAKLAPIRDVSVDNFQYSLKSQEIKGKMQTVMQENCGVVRTTHGMRNGLIQLQELMDEFNNSLIETSDLRWNYELSNTLQVRNMLILAIETVKSALRRPKSVGSHFMMD